ncbi:DUF1176 domain-containing protein [Klebsiella sp. BIGb0407]|uniref:DUF1176 domain-containing protein n=1 Tax=Klebsiella sp. BIGb0407 TaxID=2940603 RepID=UPI00216A4F24|nr:DUF1176 domain-containing protein [Klebsiella sp. BIGb0407]MCS3432260.1 hypothetical protein [Klebsiella sp. BIGb0407]
MTQRKHVTALFSRLSTQLVLSGLALAISGSVQATQIPEAVNFTHKDWDLVCDNTLTCRAAGYSSDDIDPAATVLITREAGVATPVTNKVMLADYDGETAQNTPGIPLLLINKISQGPLLTLDGDSWKMSEAQFSAFKQALQRDSTISFIDNINEYIFSGAGSSAVLLKMDDVQGRIGTPDALIKKGTASEASIKPPVAVPIIVKAPVMDTDSRDMTAEEIALIKPQILELKSSTTDCDEELLAETWQIARLNNEQSLVTVPCWRAAYNSGDVYYVIRNDMSIPPEVVTDSATDYEDGLLSFAMKGRGLGDCWNYQQWVWDGQKFVASSSGNTGRCRLIRAGGAWDMPQLVTRSIAR